MLKDKEDALKNVTKNLGKANQQIGNLRTTLIVVEAELQTQRDQFYKQLANAIFDTSTQSVQDFLASDKSKDQLTVAFGMGYKRNRVEVKNDDLFKLLKRHMSQSSVMIVEEESKGEQGGDVEVSNQVTGDGAETSRVREEAAIGDVNPGQANQVAIFDGQAQDPIRSNLDQSTFKGLTDLLGTNQTMYS